MNMFLDNLMKKNGNIQYHLVAIIVFSILYYILAVGNLVGDEEDERFTNYGSTLYYTIVTHFTIGYGDISPKSAILRLLCCVQIFTAFLLTNL